MKKPKNKFILGVIFVILAIIASQVYIAYSHSYKDTNTYLTLVAGEGVLNDSLLEIQKKYILASGDRIEILGDESFGVVQWGDGSLTRLGGNTKIIIEQNNISRDYTNINISFELIAGKTWSNIISFIGKDSSFTQRFEGVEAGVRGTVFNVDLSEELIHVSDHEVTLTSEDGNTYTLLQDQTLNLSNFSIIELGEYIAQLEDVTWKKINNELDREYIGELTKQLEDSLETQKPLLLFLLDFISPQYRIIYELNTADEYSTIEPLLVKLSQDKKSSIYKAVLSKYQDMNFVGVNNFEYYKRKIFYKKALLELANSADKQALLQSTAYDVEEAIVGGKFELLEETLSIFSGYDQYLEDVNITSLQESIDVLPVGVKKEFQSSFSSLEDVFDVTLDIDNLSEIDFGTLGDEAQKGLESIDEGIQNFLDENVGGIMKSFSQ